MSVSYVHLWWVRGFRGQSDVSEGGEHLGCPPVAGPWMLLLTDMFDSKFGVSFPPQSDNLLWKFTPLSYCYNVIHLLYSIYNCLSGSCSSHLLL